MTFFVPILISILFVTSIDGNQFRCDYTYMSTIDGWLKFHNVPANWHEARLRCHLEGAILASPITNKLHFALHTFVDRKSNNASCGFFTGLHATFSRGDFFSIEGVPLWKIPENWAIGEPDNFNDAESCIIQLNSGSLADTKCTDVFPYVCYRRDDGSSVSKSCGTVDMDYTLDTRTGSCYKFHRVPRTWSRAYMACTAEGGHLAIINSDTEANVIKEIFAKNPGGKMIGNFWKDIAFIGFHDWKEHGEWKTIHGQSLYEAGYEKFSGGEPNNATTGEFCGGVYRSGLLDDIWCENSYSFICEKKPDSLLYGKQFRCDYTYISEIDGWFKFHTVPANWHDARLRCHLEGAVLASPISYDIHMALKIFVDAQGENLASNFYTGYHATFSKGDFFSVEGEPLSNIPLNWARGEPNNLIDDECCIIQLHTGRFADVKCSDVFPYVCYKRNDGSSVSTTCGTVDKEYTLDVKTGSCYKFHRVPRTWSRAHMACAAEGGHLAIINSETEAKVLKELFAKNPGNKMVGNFWKDVAFIGFNDWNEHGEWLTIHGQTLQEAGYDKFAIGEPNNSTSGEYCGSIYRSSLLNDLWCENSYAFICEMQPNSLQCDKISSMK